MTNKEMIAVMEAADEGKTIQMTRADKNEDWYDCYNNKPEWNWVDFEYRVKPENVTRPMTIQEIFDYWKNHRTEIYKILVEDEDDENNDYFYFNTIQAIDIKHEVVFFNPTDYGQCFTPREMFDYVTKEDGSKFEVEL